MEAGLAYSASLPDVLWGSAASLLVSTYQAGQLVGVGVHDGQVTFDFHRFDQATPCRNEGRPDDILNASTTIAWSALQC